MDELDVTLADVWAALDAALDIPPIDDDPRHIAIDEVAKRHNLSVTQARRYMDRLVEAGTWHSALVRRHRGDRLLRIAVYWPKEDVS